MDVGIVGGSGYAGAELLRLLAGHPAFKVRTVAGRSSAGRDLADVFPSLGASGPVVATDPEELDGCDVVFLATPHDVSLELAPVLVGAGSSVVDLSGAFRLTASSFETWYGGAHTAPTLTPAPYGLPELFRADLAGAGLVAGPGCYPTAALLALAPLAGLVDPASVVVTGMSGTSGAGRGLRDELHHSHAAANVAPYGAPVHRHTPEIAVGWGRLARIAPPAVTFVPHLVPMARGLVCTVTASLLPQTADDAALVREAYEERYAGERFVTLLPAGAWPQTAHLTGSNVARVAVAVDAPARRVVAACALDNLTKGAAGQAIQAANAALGLDEGAGLPVAGLYP